MSETFNLAIAPMPFSNLRKVVDCPTGQTLSEVLKRHASDQVGLLREFRVFVNGVPIPMDRWDDMRPAANTLVNIRVCPQGGGGGKSPLALVLGVVLAVAAPGLGATLAGSLGLNAGTVLFGEFTIGQAFGFAISAVGKLLINAIAPPPKPKSAARSVANNAAESPTLFIEGASNVIDPYGVVPVNLGTNRVFPKQAARGFTETVNDDQYVRQLFCYGVAEDCEIAELKIGETDLNLFTNVQLEHRLEGNLDSSTGLYSNDVFQDSFNTLLSNAASWITRTSQANADELIVDVTFDRGLAEYNAQGQRVGRTVQLEVQYAPTGTSNWSTGATSFKSYALQDLTIQPIRGYDGFGRDRYRKDIVVLNIPSGVAKILTGTQTAQDEGNIQYISPPALPAGETLLATILVKQEVTIAPTTVHTYTITDNRNPAQWSGQMQNASDFLVTNPSSNTARVAAGGVKFNGIEITHSTAQAFRRSYTFPVANGQYDVRIRRTTADSASDQILDTAFWTALKTVTHTAPVTAENVCGSAMRIKATDQLSGSVEQYNVVMSTLVSDYDSGTDSWVVRKSSNPASLFRYVLQGVCNLNPLSDSEIDIEALEEWHTYCQTRGYTYDYYVDYEASVLDLLRDICAAGAASPTILDGKYSVVVDKAKATIVQMVTPHNSWGYGGEITFPDTPHAFRVEFRNADKGYRTDEVIVYDDGYNAGNATLFERLEYLSATNADLAYKHARRHLATIRLRAETHKFFMDIENLVATRGDRIVMVNDVPLVGVGSGRIQSFQDDGSNVTGVTLDDEMDFTSGVQYTARIRIDDNNFRVEVLGAMSGTTNVLTFLTPFSLPGDVSVEDLVSVFESGEELDLIISSIRPTQDLAAEITAVNYAPAIFDAETGVIPAFESNITLPFSLRQPEPPVIVKIQTNEDVMTLNSDGTYISRMVLTLQNNNEFDVTADAFIRPAGAGFYEPAEVVTKTANKIVIVGLQDGQYYDLKLIYRNAQNNRLISLPLEESNVYFEGAIADPNDVAGFKIAVSEGDNMAELSWTPNSDKDLSHYIIKFNSSRTGVTWSTAQTLRDNITNTQITTPFNGGTYLIKAVDLLGNESDSATAIITYDPGSRKNVVETLTEHSAFAGTKTNCELAGTALRLADTDSEGTYEFNSSVDLGGVYTSQVKFSLTAGGSFVNNLFEIDDLFAEDDLFGAGGGDLFAEADLFAMTDMFGIDPDDWSVDLQMRTTEDDPAGSPTWSSWATLTVGNHRFRAAEFRLKLYSNADTISPSVTALEVTVDMPDRTESDDDVTVLTSGLTVDYVNDYGGAFKNNPAVNITIQDGESDDKLEYTSKTSTGFTVKIYNTTAAAYVERSIDWSADGYGRVL